MPPSSHILLGAAYKQKIKEDERTHRGLGIHLYARKSQRRVAPGENREGDPYVRPGAE